MSLDITNNGAMPALERLVQFTEARQKVLANNVANLSTPYYRAKDLDIKEFQRSLSKAIDRRRQSNSPNHYGMNPEDTADVSFKRDRIKTTPHTTDENVMFHDRNNRDLDRTMQDVAENVMTHQLGITMLKNQFDMLRLAIRERI